MQVSTSFEGTQQAGAVGLGVEKGAAAWIRPTRGPPPGQAVGHLQRWGTRDKEQVWGGEVQGGMSTCGHCESEFPEAEDSRFLEIDTVTLWPPGILSTGIAFI